MTTSIDSSEVISPQGVRAHRLAALPVVVLVLITLLGGAIRFARLDQPTLWGDEVATYSRVIGTYQQLIDILRSDGFGPLHYSMYWAISRVVPLSPTIMHLPAAVSGTLMIPAMYFLARQLLSRRSALLVALFTACSGYLIVYSRDAKMYMHLWLFCTVHMACFLWWMRSKRWTAWLGWIAAGVAMAGFSPIGLCLLIIQPIYLITQRRPRWVDGPLFLLGAAIIASGPGVYYAMFNEWTQSSGGITPGLTERRQTNDWHASGIYWVEIFSGNRPAYDLVYHTYTSYLWGYGRLEEQPDSDERIDPMVKSASRLVPAIILPLLALGALPWRRRTGSQTNHAAAFEQPWRSAMWVGLWIMLITYGIFYCRSVDHFVSPVYWFGAIWNWLGPLWGVVLLLYIAVTVTLITWRGALLPVKLSLFLLVAGLAIGACFSGAGPSIAVRWVMLLVHPVSVACIFGIALAIAWQGAGATSRERAQKLGYLALSLAIIWTCCWLMFLVWDAMWRTAQTNNPGLDWKSLWLTRYMGILWPAVALAVVSLVGRLPTKMLRWSVLALLLAANLVTGLARVFIDSEPRVDLMAYDAYLSLEKQANVRTYVAMHNEQWGMAAGNMDWVGKYYLFHYTGRQPPPPSVFRRSPVFSFFELRANVQPTVIGREVRENPHLQRVIVWNWHEQTAPIPESDPVLTALGEGWRVESDETHVNRVWYNWQHRDAYRRRVYERTPTPGL